MSESYKILQNVTSWISTFWQSPSELISLAERPQNKPEKIKKINLLFFHYVVVVAAVFFVVEAATTTKIWLSRFFSTATRGDLAFKFSLLDRSYNKKVTLHVLLFLIFTDFLSICM